MFSELKFRASGVGALMVGSVGLTDVQTKRISELENEKLTEINANGNKVKWSPNKQKELDGLIYKRENPELSETAKRFVRETVISAMTKARKEIKSKYLEKGLLVEDDSISLLSDIDNNFYIKNFERKSDDYFTGECDISEMDVIQDVKSSWDIFTFYEAEWKQLYYAQGQVYMRLWGANEFWLRYCLVNKPYAMYRKEIDALEFKYGNSEVSFDKSPNYHREYDIINYNSLYSGDFALRQIPPEERVITFKCVKDDEYMKELIERVEMARKYASEWWETRLTVQKPNRFTKIETS